MDEPKALFEIDQAVTPIGTDWEVFFDGRHALGLLPKLGEIYHVAQYGEHDDFPGRLLIRLKELGPDDWYFQECFAPVMPDEQFQEAIMQILPKEEEVESPV